MKTNSTLPTWCSLSLYFISVTIISVSLLIIVGWALNIPALKHVSLLAALSSISILTVIIWVSALLLNKESQRRTNTEELLNFALKSADAGAWRWNILDNKYEYDNHLLNLFGLTTGDLLKNYDDFLSLIHPLDRARLAQEMQTCATEEGEFDSEFRLTHPDQSLHYFYSKAKVYRNKFGEVTHLIGICWDITQRKQAEKLIHSSKEDYELIIDSLPNLVAYIDSEFHCRYLNKAFEIWFNKPLHTMTGKNIKDILNYADYESLIENYQKINDGIINYETVMKFQNDKERYVNVTLVPHLKEKFLHGTYILVSDITSHINYLATHDVLTKLPNRSLFMAYFTRALHAAQKNNNAVVALLFIDLDFFKNINDTLGHDIGDALLIKVSQSLAKHIRKKDLLSRLGGDEFTIIIEELNDIQEIIAIVQKICKSFENVFKIQNNEITMTASIGISIYPNDALDIQTLLKNADMAMYRAKERGRNTFEFYTQEINERMLQKRALESTLHSALKKQQFEIYYQPIFNFQSNKIDGMEALLRWHHPEAGLILPSKFVSLAEKMGIMNRIDEWVLNSACQQYVVWQEKNIQPSKIVINISSQQFKNARKLIETIYALLQEKNIDGKHLILEISEHSVMENIEHSFDTIKKLKNLGILISIDAFEGGYSSLSYINTLPIDMIKINHSFVSNLTIPNGTEKIVAAIISMAQNLNLTISAVGVENFEQYSILKHLGCNEIQGYLIYSPQRIEDATTILSKPFSIDEHINCKKQDKFALS